jgi:hypothetical protein
MEGIVHVAVGDEGVVEGGERGAGCFISSFEAVGCDDCICSCEGDGERGSIERVVGSIDFGCRCADNEALDSPGSGAW